MSPEEHLDGDGASPVDAPQRAPHSPRGAAADEAAGLPTSRPPSNPISYGGEDWVTLSLYVRHRDFTRTTKLLDERRKAAEERRDGADELQLAGQTFLVLPFGAKVGTKRSKAHFRWQLQSETGYVLQFMNLPSFEGTMPNAKLIATSLVMMRLGIEGVVERAYKAIEALGANVVRDKVSRVDPCCDLPGRQVEPLKAAYEAGQVVCRADRNDEHGAESHFVDSDYSLYRVRHETTSFNIGRGDTR